MYKGSRPYSGRASRFVQKVFCHIQVHYCHKSLGTTVKLEVAGSPYRMTTKMFVPRNLGDALVKHNCDIGNRIDCRRFERLERDQQNNATELLKLTSNLIRKNKAHLVLYLGNLEVNGWEILNGVATTPVVCGRNDGIKFTVNEATHWNRMNLLGEHLAHEIGHTLGMQHDHERDRKRRCNCKGLMSYRQHCGRGIPAQWSSCSREDFKNHYNQVIRQNRKWCLKSKFFLNKE